MSISHLCIMVLGVFCLNALHASQWWATYAHHQFGQDEGGYYLVYPQCDLKKSSGKGGVTLQLTSRVKGNSQEEIFQLFPSDQPLPVMHAQAEHTFMSCRGDHERWIYTSVDGTWRVMYTKGPAYRHRVESQKEIPYKPAVKKPKVKTTNVCIGLAAWVRSWCNKKERKG